MLVSIAAGAYRWWQSGPGRLRRGGGEGGGGGGAGRAAPIGGPRSPAPLRAASRPRAEPELVSAVAATATGAPTASPAPDERSWAEPLDDGSCPASHPIKVNESSGIFHVPGGRFYDRTVAGRCYANEDAASADGFRPAKA